MKRAPSCCLNVVQICATSVNKTAQIHPMLDTRW